MSINTYDSSTVNVNHNRGCLRSYLLFCVGMCIYVYWMCLVIGDPLQGFISISTCFDGVIICKWYLSVINLYVYTFYGFIPAVWYMANVFIKNSRFDSGFNCTKSFLVLWWLFFRFVKQATRTNLIVWCLYSIDIVINPLVCGRLRFHSKHNMLAAC